MTDEKNDSTNDEMEFDDVMVIPFKIRNRKTKEFDHYCITDISSEDRTDYLIKLEECVETNEKGERTVPAKHMKTMSVELLRRCTHEYDPKTEDIGKLVDAEVLRTWSSRIMDAIADKANLACGFGAEASDDVKKP